MIYGSLPNNGFGKTRNSFCCYPLTFQHTQSITDAEDDGGGSDNDQCDESHGDNFFSRLISDQLTMLAPFLLLVSALTAEAADTLKGNQH